MRTLHAYLLRQVLGTLAMTVAVFTFFALLISVLNEILGLVVSQQVSLVLIGKAILLLVPYVLVHSLPMGLLTAGLLVFGRMSADQEITAMRASGVSLVRLVSPLLVLSIGLSVVCASITLHFGPKCRLIYKDLLRDVGLTKATALIPENTYIRDFSGAIVYVNKVDGSYLEDILIYELKGDSVESFTRATSGEIQINGTNNLVSVLLTNAFHTRFMEGQRLPQTFSLEDTEFVYTNTGLRKADSRVELDNMTFSELQRELQELEVQTSKALELGPAVKLAKTPEERRKAERLRRAWQTDLTYPVRLQIHKQVAFSFACIGFTLVGIPLGIRAHRRETSFGVAIGIVLVLVYNSFFILGSSLASKPELSPHLILWLPNFFFQIVGGVLLWRANRGG